MTAVETQSRAVPVRTPDFEDELRDLPKHFAAGGDIVMSHILAVLSSVFPDGEDYFVRSVEAVKDRITDPVLRADIEGFIGQESMHGLEHRVLNERLAELGYPTHAIGVYVRRLTKLREPMQGKKMNLAITAGLEHYTATLAETLLGNRDAREVVGDNAVRSVLLWHALEESEHKAVAFDVFKQAGGGERLRSLAMWMVHATFVLETGAWTLISLAMDPDAWRHPIRLLRSFLRLRTSPFTSPAAVHQLFSYHRRGFHPNDRDTSALIAEWRERLFGEHGQLTSLLAG
jgi:predicted metal-dependent hydrolase